jgi:hypothetical protein
MTKNTGTKKIANPHSASAGRYGHRQRSKDEGASASEVGELPKFVSNDRRLKLGRFLRVRLGRRAPSDGSLYYRCGTESPAALCRFDMSFCLVHDISHSVGRHWTNLIESVAQSPDVSEL